MLLLSIRSRRRRVPWWNDGRHAVLFGRTRRVIWCWQHIRIRTTTTISSIRRLQLQIGQLLGQHIPLLP